MTVDLQKQQKSNTRKNRVQGVPSVLFDTVPSWIVPIAYSSIVVRQHATFQTELLIINNKTHSIYNLSSSLIKSRHVQSNNLKETFLRISTNVFFL